MTNKEAGAAIEIETIEIGEKVYLRGNSAGIEPSAWESLRSTKVFLKAPITTLQGVTQTQVLGVLQRLIGANLEIAQTVGLSNFDGKAGFTPAQGR